MSGVLDSKLRDRLLDALIQVPGTDTSEGRSALLSGIPANIRAGLNRASSAVIDLTNLIDQIDGLGRLDNGERPVVMLVNNACRVTRGSELGHRLEQLSTEIEKKYDVEPALAGLSDKPEVLIFGGEGEWVEGSFLDQAQTAGLRVARLSVPRFVGGQRIRGAGYGTGWLVAPRLMLTNHHVIDARDPTKKEPHATPEDFKLQAANTTAWFDYRSEGSFTGPAVAATGVVAQDSDLDFALLRLEDKPELTARRSMGLAPNSPLQRGARLNIVQCPGGGPLRYAIRNNFFVGIGQKPHQVRYLTDTVSGSSGSPVLDDNWRVVAMHRGAKEIDPQAYKGEDGSLQVVKYHNEGIAIHDILSRLPADVKVEIEAAKG